MGRDKEEGVNTKSEATAFFALLDSHKGYTYFSSLKLSSQALSIVHLLIQQIFLEYPLCDTTILSSCVISVSGAKRSLPPLCFHVRLCWHPNMKRQTIHTKNNLSSVLKVILWKKKNVGQV